MDEIGLFPLGLVLLPTEQVPLHIFEPRYRELITECVDEERPFGLVYADDDGIRQVGTLATVVEVTDRFEDGRLNIVVEGGDRFKLLELTEGRSFQTGTVEPVVDRDDPPSPDDAGSLACHVRLYAHRHCQHRLAHLAPPPCRCRGEDLGPDRRHLLFLALVTGSLWGKPMWGTYWVWDARLTSMLVLFLLYLGLIALWQSIEEPGRAGRAAAILALVGFVNVPIIKFSVDWWNTLHQPASIFRTGGPTIDPSLLTPLFVMAVGFTLLFVLLHLIAMRAEILRRRVHALPPGACRARSGSLRPTLIAMPDLGPHAAFIWAAYAVTFVAVAGLVGVIVQDDRRQRQLLADLERQGITRRSAKPAAKPQPGEKVPRAKPKP